LNAVKQITFATESWAEWPSWTPDGRIVYGSDASGDEDLWIVGTDGRNPKQLTANTLTNEFPSVSPDGRFVAFTGGRTGLPHIWKMDIDGGNPRQLTDGRGEAGPSWSPDGRWIYYTSIPPVGVVEKSTIWRIPSNGGTPAQITSSYSWWADVSPDGKLIACLFRKSDGSPLKVGVLPAEGGTPLKLLEIPPLASRLTWPPFRWSHDGKSLVDVENRNGVSNLWSFPLDGSKPKQLTNFQSDLVWSFVSSPDGTQLAVSRGMSASNAILINNVQ
ncbi:DPP IV N-terminal domain-containing protein, partial [Edaphobacter aggregans]|uniref:DPP IV N-terminal domain-containing protein n=1 Tax=Edaphobacter aggregans TaxID=570835 RepID=UPI00054FD60F